MLMARKTHGSRPPREAARPLGLVRRAAHAATAARPAAKTWGMFEASDLPVSPSGTTLANTTHDRTVTAASAAKTRSRRVCSQDVTPAGWRSGARSDLAAVITCRKSA